MEQFNNQMALVQASAKLGMQIGQERKHTRRYSVSTEKMIILLFTRMADLFGSKAANKGLDIYWDEEKEIYSEQFDLWSWKLDDLTIEDFKCGMDGLEKRAEQCYRDGEEMWPPSYAEFRALAFPLTSRDQQAHKVFDKLLLPDLVAISKSKQAGRAELDKMLGMFEELGPKPLTAAEILDLDKLERIKNG